MVLNSDNNPVHRHVKFSGSRCNDTKIRLMRNQPVNGRFIYAVGLQCFIDHFAQLGHSHSEYLTATHFDISSLLLHFSIPTGNTFRYVQQLGVPTISMQVGTVDTWCLRSLQQNRSGTISKQYAGISVLPIENT